MPDDVQVSIGGDVTPFRASLANLRESVTQTGGSLKQMGESLGFEGLKGERKIHRQLEGFLQAAQNIQSAGDLAGMAIMRLGSITKMALPLMIGFVVATEVFKALKENIDKGEERLRKFGETAEKINGTDLFSASIDELKEFQKDLQEQEKDYAKRPWIERVLFGDRENRMKARMDAMLEEVSAQLHAAEEKAIRDETKAKYGHTDREKMEGEIGKVRTDFDHRIAKAEHDKEGAGVIAALKEEEEAAISEIVNKFQEGESKKEQAVRDRIAKQKQEEEDAIEKARLASVKKAEEEKKEIAKLDAEAQEEREKREDLSPKKQLYRIQGKLQNAESRLSIETNPVEIARLTLEVEKLKTAEAEKQAEIRGDAAEAEKKAAEETKKETEDLVRFQKEAAEDRKKVATFDGKADLAHTHLSLLASQMRLQGGLRSLNASGHATAGDAVATRHRQELVTTMKGVEKQVTDLNKKLGIL